MQALMIAYSCRPKSGSEWGVGWNYLVMLSALYDKVTLYVRDAEKQPSMIQEELTNLNISNVTMRPITDVQFWIKAPALFRGRLLLVCYIFWLVKLFFVMLKKRDFVEHECLFHITWVSDWIWSPFYLLPFRRKTIGPLGSQASNFYRDSEDFWLSRIRAFIKKTLRHNPLNYLNAILATNAIAISRRNAESLPWSLIKKRAVITPVHSELKAQKRDGNKCRLLYLGKYLTFKNLDLFLLCADSILAIRDDVEIVLAGDPLCGVIDGVEQMTAKHPGKILQLGKLPHGEVQQLLCEYNPILLQTSSETGGTVGVECLSCGVPVICVAGYGLSAFFDDEYPHALYYDSPQHFSDNVIKRTTEIWANYHHHSNIAFALSSRFKIEESRAKLSELLFD